MIRHKIENKLFSKLQKSNLIEEIEGSALNIISIIGDIFFISDDCAIINIKTENLSIESKFYIVNNFGLVQ